MNKQEESIFESELKKLNKTLDVLEEINEERERQRILWGEQQHENGTGQPSSDMWREIYRNICETKVASGSVTWHDILKEEVYEAFAESDPEKLREELVQVGAVCVSWIEAIDRQRENS